MSHASRRALFLAAVVLAVLYGFLPRTEQVDLVGVTRGPLQVTIEEEGRTRLQERFVVSVPAAGTLRRITRKVGDAVKRGERIAVLEPLRPQVLDARTRAEAEATLTAQEAALAASVERARAAAADARYVARRQERIAALFAKRYVAKDQFDQTTAEAEKAEATRKAAEAAVAVARSELERARTVLRSFASLPAAGPAQSVEVFSPASGSVLRLFRESEGVIGVGEPLMEIGDAGDLEVRVEVLSSDAVRIRPGGAVLFKRWGRDEPLAGRVRLVEPAGFTKVSSLGVEEQRVLVIADITSPRDLWRQLGDGYRLEAHFVVWESQNVLQVPVSALFRSGEQWAVFVEEAGRARLRRVEIGQRTGLTAECLAGVNERDRVVAYPEDAIHDGTRIRQSK